jgi:hypothetical protein
MTGTKLTNKLRSADGEEATATARRLRELRGFEQAFRQEAERG